jgi:hypothetical protein
MEEKDKLVDKAITQECVVLVIFKRLYGELKCSSPDIGKENAPDLTDQNHRIPPNKGFAIWLC